MGAYIIGVTDWTELAISKHNLFSAKNTTEQEWVLLYIKSNLHLLVISKHTIENINAIYIQLSLRKIIVSLIYQPAVQTKDIDDKISEKIAEISCQNEYTIFGYFHLQVTKWVEQLN